MSYYKKILNMFKRAKDLGETNHKSLIEIPIRHFVQLKKLSQARSEGFSSTIIFLLAEGFSNEENWIDEDSRFTHLKKTDTQVIEIESNQEDILLKIKDNKILLEAIQAIPFGIRPATDGIHKDAKISFFVENGIQGININGMKFLDPSKPGERDQQMYEFIKDKFKISMTQGTMAHSLTKFESTGNKTAPSIKDPSKRTVKTKLLGEDFIKRGFKKVDNLHVSVNGYEAEVLEGLGDYSSKIGVFRVVSIFKKDGVLVADKVENYYLKNKILYAGRSGGSLIAGPLSPFYHVNGHQYEWLKND